MKLVMTLVARDEADIVDSQIAFHLNAGVDFVIATDHVSTDGTTEILERYARSGYLHLLRETDDKQLQDVWVTRMARLAATDFGADWVINADADEFWWPRGGTLKEILELVPERFGIVRGCWRHFPPRCDAGGHFAERMVARLCVPAFPGDKRTIYHAHQKVAHRAHPEVQIEFGNHNASAPGLEPLRGWHPVEILHFSHRSLAQTQRKARAARARVAGPLSDHLRAIVQAEREGSLAEHFARFTVTEEQLARGLAEGRYAIDTRLRDALRSLRREDGTLSLPPTAPPLRFPTPSVEETAAFAAEASVLAAIDALPRAETRLDGLEARLSGLRRLPRR